MTAAEGTAAEEPKAEASSAAETLRRLVQGDLSSVRVVLGLVLIWRYRRRARAHLARTQPATYRAMTGQDDAAPSDR